MSCIPQPFWHCTIALVHYGMRMAVLILDNRDSFTHNLSQAVRGLQHDAVVRRAEEITLADIAQMQPRAIILSPGPGQPREHPFMFNVIAAFLGRTPILGVCLGMQALNEHAGGTLTRTLPVHGKQSHIHHDGHWLFAGLSSPFAAARYHSLIVDRLGADCSVIARTQDELPMALEYRDAMACGVQFHPESYLTPQGDVLLRNFLNHTCSQS